MCGRTEYVGCAHESFVKSSQPMPNRFFPLLLSTCYRLLLLVRSGAESWLSWTWRGTLCSVMSQDRVYSTRIIVSKCREDTEDALLVAAPTEEHLLVQQWDGVGQHFPHWKIEDCHQFRQSQHREISRWNPHTHLCCLSHICVFPTNFKNVKKIIIITGFQVVWFIAKKHCYNKGIVY